MKKTIIMDIDKTIKRIEKTANLKVLGVKEFKAEVAFLPPPPQRPIYLLNLRYFCLM